MWPETFEIRLAVALLSAAAGFTGGARVRHLLPIDSAPIIGAAAGLVIGFLAAMPLLVILAIGGLVWLLWRIRIELLALLRAISQSAHKYFGRKKTCAELMSEEQKSFDELTELIRSQPIEDELHRRQLLESAEQNHKQRMSAIVSSFNARDNAMDTR